MIAEVKKQLQKKKHHRFSSFFVCYTVVHLVVVAVILCGLWEWLREYEMHTPKQVVAATAQNVEQGDLSLFENAFDPATMVFSTKDDLMKNLSDYLQDKKITTRQQEETEYLLLADDEQFASIQLQTTGQKTFFGFEKQQVTDVSLLRSFQNSYTITAPKQAKVTVNGISLTAEYQVEQQPVTGYQQLTDFEPAILQVYQVQATEVPVVNATLNGTECEIKQEETEIEVIGKVSQQDQTELSNIAQEVAQLYSRYITQDATFAQLRGYFIQGTEFFKALSTFYNPWYVTHDSYHYETQQCDDFRQYSQTQISCMLQFKYEIYRGTKVHDFSGKYRVYFQKDADEWKVAMLEVV